jgi:hypothetical protein
MQQQQLVKTGGWLVKHARYYWLMLAESHLTKPPFAGDGAADGGFTAASRVGLASRRNQPGQTEEVGEEVSEKSLRNGANYGFFVSATAHPGTPRLWPWTKCEEDCVRGTGVYAAAAGKAKWKSRLTYTFPLLNHSLGTGMTIWIYGLICALGFALVWNRLPETRGKTL